MREETTLRVCKNKNCTNFFRVPHYHIKSFCSSGCEQETVMNREYLWSVTEWRDLNSKLARGDLMGRSGLTVHGDQKKALNEEKKSARSTMPVISAKKTEQPEKEINITTPPNLREKKMKESENTTKKIESSAIKEEVNGERKIESENVSNKGNGMPEIKKENSQKSLSADVITTPQLDSSRLLTVLNEERLGSIRQLNNINDQLIGYAKSLAKPATIADDGEVIKRSSTPDLELAIKCLTESRNVMKTKLDYMKFGKELFK